MLQLNRVTTQYVENEDRLRLTGEGPAGETCVVWITRRLLGRLLPALFGWLEGRVMAAPRAEILQSFAQEAARASIKRQPPVRAPGDSISFLVISIEVTRGDKSVLLKFRGAEDKAASFTLEAQPLRQWLAIVQSQCGKAEWRMQEWPVWMTESEAMKLAPGAKPH